VPKGTLVPLNIESKANQRLTEKLHNEPGNSLEELPQGDQTFAGVKFAITDDVLQLSGRHLRGRPRSITAIPANVSATHLYFLHSAGWEVPRGTVIGEYRVNFEEGVTATIPIVFGSDVHSWQFRGTPEFIDRGVPAWIGSNTPTREWGGQLILFASRWENPHPEKRIVSIDFVSKMTTCAPFCIAITAEKSDKSDDG